jgi:hypothetical protein
MLSKSTSLLHDFKNYDAYSLLVSDISMAVACLPSSLKTSQLSQNFVMIIKVDNVVKTIIGVVVLERVLFTLFCNGVRVPPIKDCNVDEYQHKLIFI